MHGNDDETVEIDLRDTEAKEIDLRDRLRFAAGSLAADFGEELSTDHAEALVFSSAERLLASASVTEFVPVLAERRARLAVRSGQNVAVPLAAPAPAEPLPPPEPLPTPEPPPAATSASEPAVTPLLAAPAEDLTRLRGEVERLRQCVAGWQAERRG